MASTPPWRLSSVRVQDFRSIKDACIDLEDVTVLVGANNTGKSAVLQAVMLALSGGYSSPDDLHMDKKGKPAGSYVIDLRFEPWPSDIDFPQVVLDRFTKAPGLLSTPPYISVRVTGEPTNDGSRIELRRELLAGWERDRSAAQGLGVVPDAPISKIMWSMQQAGFLGPSRDLEPQTRQRTSHLGQAVADLRLPATDAKTIMKDVAALTNKITAASPTLTGLEGSIRDVGTAVDQALQNVSVSVLPPDVGELGQQLDIRFASHGGPLLPLRLQGHGTRSLAAIAVSGALSRQPSPGSGPQLAITCIEEPETHLHPQAHDAVQSKIGLLPGQVLVTTHSPFVARSVPMKSLRVLKCSDGATEIHAVPELDHRGLPVFTPQQLANADRFLRQRLGDTLFARCVLLIEGATEGGAIPVLADEYFGTAVAALGLTIVSIDGAGSWPHFVKPLHHLGVRWLLALDGDGAGQTQATKFQNEMPAGSHSRLLLLPNNQDFEAMMARSDKQACLDFLRQDVGVAGLGPNVTEARTAKLLRKHKTVERGRSLAERFVGNGKMPAPMATLFARAKAELT